MPTAQQQLSNMTWIPGGAFLMGSADFYPEERPPRADGGRPLLRAASSARGGTGAAGAQGDQGRLSSMAAQLLPALPARCLPGEAIDTSTCHLGFRCVVRNESREGNRACSA
jgi:hypothetical protein